MNFFIIETRESKAYHLSFVYFKVHTFKINNTTHKIELIEQFASYNKVNQITINYF